MRLILLGAPGCGKGTISSLMKNRYGYVHISTGDLIRNEISQNTTLGLCLKDITKKGELISDEIVATLLKNKLSKDKISDNFILDGFPRTISQAKLLEDIVEIDKVIFLDVDYESILQRLSFRRVCSGCNKVFSTQTYKNQSCDICGGELYKREDDNEDVIKNRFEVYEIQTKPLIDYYKKKNILKTVISQNDIEKDFEKVIEILEGN